ncbi:MULTISPECIES: sterol desaturase family protein [unclassified Alteromonas]|uniref:sterol desaturase family protein n=1 Tax=unclassified Alteromonas TaxID=2614992 RepID=UPI00192410BC|nr:MULTISPECIES: sterol desaturase family protein [unclassified Alteromonas]WDT86115.1 sterol desaturase family protein [Alteromonas sp. 009811495]BCO21064.1 sterol desaturase [Alteromonas sp. KC3]BCO25034.1 sterol desaturase [Alteromonas sp. KC14]
MTVILFAIPLFFLLIGIELYVDYKRKTGHYRTNDAITSLSAGVLSRVVAIGHQLIPFTIYVLVYDAIALFSLPDAWWVWVIAFVAYDFFYYWNHRMGHEMSILWAAHVVHHSSEDYNLTTALRQTSGALFSWVFYLPLALVGFEPEMIITVGALNLVYQFWVHTQHIKTLGWMEYVFVTPSNHRVHHAQNRVYIDKNYGGVFILWDRLFGTFIPELDEEPPVYGIRGALKSFNPIWANLQIYSQLARDSYYTRSWKDKFRVWFGRTGWRPEDVSMRFVQEKKPLSEFKKYHPKLHKAVTRYSLVQHLIMLGVTLYLLLNINALPTSHQLIAVATVIVMSIQNGFILSQSKMSLAMEGPRLLVFPLMWVAGGMGVAAIVYTLCSFASLFMLANAVRHTQHRPPLEEAVLPTEPDNLA